MIKHSNGLYEDKGKFHLYFYKVIGGCVYRYSKILDKWILCLDDSVKERINHPSQTETNEMSYTKGDVIVNITTNDQIDLCDVVAQKIVEIAGKQGKRITHDEVFNMLFGGDYCDTFDGILEAIK